MGIGGVLSPRGKVNEGDERNCQVNGQIIEFCMYAGVMGDE